MKTNMIVAALTVCSLWGGIWGITYAQEKISDEEAMALVEKAGKLLEKKGDAALEMIGDPDGEFFMKDNALYVFVYDPECVILAHPYKPTLVGRSYQGKPDVRGKIFREELVEKALEEGNGWTYYSYQKPGENGIHQKKVFGKLFESEGKKYIVCAGVYID
ncbi:hypothetical protein CSA56_01900 [candidate division KSB3 bacterium]|uniref:Single Cache domain-containing protein n=1 Tax=candidate division KSB3 bacterium TaxID=2044937 RepID=A0A2G6KJZ1_9BACT|nr:MAG: hypothetical protein CSA56_01900 [candidate division KSB3 bacterium]